MTLRNLLGPNIVDAAPPEWVTRLEREAPVIVAHLEAGGADPAPLLEEVLEIGRRAGSERIDRYAFRTQQHWSLGAVGVAAMLARYPDRTCWATPEAFGAFVRSYMAGYHESEAQWREMTGEPTSAYLERFGHRPPGLDEAERRRRARIAVMLGLDVEDGIG